MKGAIPVPGPTIIIGRRLFSGKENGLFKRPNKGTLISDGNLQDDRSSHPEQSPVL